MTRWGWYSWCGAGGDNGVGVVGGGFGREFVLGWSWVWALATPGGGLVGHLWLAGLLVSVVLAASGVWACPVQSWRGAMVLSMPVMFAVAGG